MEHDELYSYILRRSTRTAPEAKPMAPSPVTTAPGVRIPFPYTEGGLKGSPAAIYWAWFQLAIGQRLRAASASGQGEFLKNPSLAGIVQAAAELGKPLSSVEKAHLALVPISTKWLQEALGGA
mmetsp:Transcript_9294/g.17120  ORF Transcript_9294/g.17120 Transcript_9294/m.17120 type:complete len:123 (+) Transcript_9294:40-408(+)